MIRIPESRYDRIVRIARLLPGAAERKMQQGKNAYDCKVYPTAEDLEKHDVEYNIRKYLKYIVYLRVVHDTDEDYHAVAKKRVEEICENCIDIVSDEDMALINKTTAEEWNKMSLEDKVRVFAPLLQYYAYNEFATFFSDLTSPDIIGYRPFMGALKIKKDKMHEKGALKRLQKQMLKIWDIYFKN